jgi:hypothetical protein
LHFEWDGWHQWDPDYSRAPDMTPIEMPDLQMIYSLVIQDIPTVRLVAMPRLEEVWQGLPLLQGEIHRPWLTFGPCDGRPISTLMGCSLGFSLFDIALFSGL